MSRASEWKAKALEAAECCELPLPSGMVVTARRPGPIQIAFFRRLPLALAQQALAGEKPDPQSASPEEVIENLAFMRDLLVYCLVDPRVSLDPKGEDEIHPRDIPQGDWQFILRWAMRAEEAAKLAPFRVERRGDPAGSHGEIVELPSVATAGDRGPGFSAEF